MLVTVAVSKEASKKPDVINKHCRYVEQVFPGARDALLYLWGQHIMSGRMIVLWDDAG
jgi:hypothetical protein